MHACPCEDYLGHLQCHYVQVRVYELGQLSLKFERHFDAEIVDFQVPSSAAIPLCFLTACFCMTARSQALPERLPTLPMQGHMIDR